MSGDLLGTGWLRKMNSNHLVIHGAKDAARKTTDIRIDGSPHPDG
ncbi:hypothetical protein ACPOL_5859 [Acidisarcina polymorpha]|uniref:Uncharacterized protein n=1 Tax=Acidisarcina polymorpha TaxID=2211140 RepID=A0A2Z5G761_9BACT|nr:hypothetical protein ACPOL_5859 [Acidisarcina polymorpha]